MNNRNNGLNRCRLFWSRAATFADSGQPRFATQFRRYVSMNSEIFAKTCRSRCLEKDCTERHPLNEEMKQAYVNQIKYLNRRIEEDVDYILKKSPVPPVIIIQGDHGSWFTLPAEINDASLAEFAKERMTILNAYYVPTAMREVDRAHHAGELVSLAVRSVLRRALSLLDDKNMVAWYGDKFDLLDVAQTLHPAASTRGQSPAKMRPRCRGPSDSLRFSAVPSRLSAIPRELTCREGLADFSCTQPPKPIFFASPDGQGKVGLLSTASHSTASRGNPRDICRRTDARAVMYQNHRIIVIAPAYNEEAKIGLAVAKVPRDVADQVLVVDDGSTDRTAQTARDAGASVLSLGQVYGVGYALRTALEFARQEGFDIAVIMAGNNKDEPREIPRLLGSIVGGADLVIGSRYLAGGAYGGDMPRYRKWATRLHPRLLSLACGKRLTESTNGFREIRMACLQDRRINLQQKWLDGYAPGNIFAVQNDQAGLPTL